MTAPKDANQNGKLINSLVKPTLRCIRWLKELIFQKIMSYKIKRVSQLNKWFNFTLNSNWAQNITVITIIFVESTTEHLLALDSIHSQLKESFSLSIIFKGLSGSGTMPLSIEIKAQMAARLSTKLKTTSYLEHTSFYLRI